MREIWEEEKARKHFERLKSHTTTTTTIITIVTTTTITIITISTIIIIIKGQFLLFAGFLACLLLAGVPCLFSFFLS